MLPVLFGSGYPSWDYCEEGELGRDSGFKSIENEALLVWPVMDRLT